MVDVRDDRDVSEILNHFFEPGAYLERRDYTHVSLFSYDKAKRNNKVVGHQHRFSADSTHQMIKNLMFRFLYSSVFMLTGIALSAPAYAVGLEIVDPHSLHVHADGAAFEIGLHNNGRQYVDVQWVNEHGEPLTTKATLKPGDALNLMSPSDTVGYYGLRSTSLQGERESGFVILPAAVVNDQTRRATRPSYPFGMVHADNSDPYLGHWTKTATWETYRASDWANAMQRRRDQGKTELPIVTGKEWSSDDSQAIDDEHLDRLRQALMAYFSADPLTIHWEMGLEENLTPAFRQKYYWANLDAKMQVAREVADDVNPNIRFAYQLATTDVAVVEDFLNQPVARRFGILSLHPYHWPAFVDPEKWLPDFLRGVRATQNRFQSEHVLWMTEVGAPQHLNPAGGRFNFGQAINVRGHSRGEAVSYMVKLVTIALHGGVEKIFWYNYRDRGNLRADPENFFGLRDFEGFPKPSYLAWYWLTHMLRNAQPEKQLTLSSRVQDYRFTRRNEMCAVAWSVDDRSYDVDPVSLLGKQSGRVLAINLMGQSLPREAGLIKVGREPVLACTETE